MEPDDILPMVRELAVVPGFNGYSEAVLYATATKVVELCETTEDAYRLLKAAKELPKWEGFPGLQAIYDSQHEEKNLWQEPDWLRDGYQPPEAEGRGCRKCMGTGAVNGYDREGVLLWRVCECSTNDSSAAAHVENLNQEGRRLRLLRADSKRKHKQHLADHRAIRAELRIAEGEAPSPADPKPAAAIPPPTPQEVVKTLNRAVSRYAAQANQAHDFGPTQ